MIVIARCVVSPATQFSTQHSSYTLIHIAWPFILFGAAVPPLVCVMIGIRFCMPLIYCIHPRGHVNSHAILRAIPWPGTFCTFACLCRHNGRDLGWVPHLQHHLRPGSPGPFAISRARLCCWNGHRSPSCITRSCKIYATGTI